MTNKVRVLDHRGNITLIINKLLILIGLKIHKIESIMVSGEYNFANLSKYIQNSKWHNLGILILHLNVIFGLACSNVNLEDVCFLARRANESISVTDANRTAVADVLVGPHLAELLDYELVTLDHAMDDLVLLGENYTRALNVHARHVFILFTELLEVEVLFYYLFVFDLEDQVCLLTQQN